MSVVIRFNTKRLDVTSEPPNPINPIFGEALLRWLKQALPPPLVLEEAEPEDWGWYAHMDWEGRRFMLGSSASDEEDGQREWVLQIVPERTLKERILGKGKVTRDHPLVLQLLALLSGEPAFTGVAAESEA
jgi:hypothetical protein